ncbi:glycosyltransferase family 4 protein [candidate division KSB1 bacterium]|nr:glycosyltransferase family 4 protein [candidate division KSB1 bacterium]
MKRNPKSVLAIAFKYYYQDPRIQRQLKALVQDGYVVDFICPHDEHVVYPNIKNLHFIKINVKKKRASKLRYMFEYLSFFTLTTLKCIILDFKKKYGLIQIFVMPELLAFCVAIPRLFGVRVLMDWEDPAYEVYLSKFQNKKSLFSFFLQVIERYAIKMVDEIITPNEGFVRAFVARGCPREKLNIITNSPESDIFDPQKVNVFKSQNGQYTILYTGTITKRQGLDIAFRALRNLKDKSNRFRMVVVGDGEFWPEAQRVALDLDVYDHVNYLGRVPLETIPKLILESDVGLIPNRNEPFTRINFPTRILEHAAMRVPIAAPELPGILDYVDDSSVCLFEPENAEAMANAIFELSRNPVKQQQLTENAYKIYQQMTWERMKEEYLQIVKNVIAGK